MNLDRLVDAKTKLNKKFTNLQLQHVAVHIVSRVESEQIRKKKMYKEYQNVMVGLLETILWPERPLFSSIPCE